MEIIERPFNPSDAFKLMKEGVPAVLARAWSARGIRQVKDVTGTEASLLPYSSLKGTEKFASLVADAIAQKKRILIIGDYDADGATATAIGMRALTGLGANVGYLIPDRHEHGYGLTPAIVELAATETPKPDIIVTVDNGISSLAGVARANELGMAVYVTDHHLPAMEKGSVVLPDCAVLVNPNQPDCAFTSKSLAGCGVIWYCMWALQEELLDRGTLPDNAPDVHALLPIVAIGTIADVVGLDKNNRTLVTLGLERIRATRTFAGIEELAKIAGVNPREIATADVGFQIGPRINAAGRLKSMDAGVECLTTDSLSRAKFLANELHNTNNLRKDIEGDIVEEAVRQLLTEVTPGRFTTVLYSEQWHHGVIGIVAGRIKEKTFRPTFVLASAGSSGEIKGSGRSIPGFHLRDALDMVANRAPGVLLKFGGHAMAAGVTIRSGGLEEFVRVFEEVSHELLRPTDLMQSLETDGSLEPGELNLGTVALLREQVWGQLFPEPAFCDVFKVLEARTIGEGKHLKLLLEKGGTRFQAVRFRYEGPIPSGSIRAVYKLSPNVYKEKTSLQLLVDYFE